MRSNSGDLYRAFDMEHLSEHLQTEMEIPEAAEPAVWHNPQIGVELTRLDDTAQLLQQHAHHFAWLLQSGFCAERAQQDTLAIREQLQALTHIVERLEALGNSLSEGEILTVPLCAALNEELAEWRSLFYKLPAAANLDEQESLLGQDIAQLNVEGKTLAQKVEVLVNRKSEMSNTRILRERLCFLRERIEVLTTRSLEEELDWLWKKYWQTRQREGSGQEERQEHQARIIRRRFGWDGMPAGTLQAASEAALWEITRERARQIVIPFEEWLQRSRPFVPAIQRAVHLIESQLPCLAEDIEISLRDEGLTQQEFRIEALRDVAQSLGIETRLNIAALPSDSGVESRLVWLAEDEGSADYLEFALKALQDHIWERGIGHLPSLRSDLENESVNAAELLDAIIETLPQVRWLERNEGWFWLTSSQVMRRQENRLLTHVERTLSVAGCLEIPRLHAAIARHHNRVQDRPNRLEWEIPPLSIFREWCHQVPFGRVESDQMEMENPLPIEEVLSGVELTIIQVIRQHGPLLSRWKFQQLCTEQGVAKPTFYIYVDGLSTVEEFDEGIFGLTGTHVTEEILAAFSADFNNFSRQRSTRYGRLDDGRVWISYQLTEGVINNGTLNIPRAMQGLFVGRYLMKDFEGVPVGNLGFNTIQYWGLKPYFRERAKANDRFTIIIDENSKQAVVTLTNEDLPAEITDNL